MKTCTKCGETKPFSEYTKHKLGRDGLRPQCKTCTAVANAAYRERTVEQRAEYNSRWKRDHRENHLAYNQAWIRRNPEKTAAHRAVRQALHRGDLVRPKSCEGCGDNGRIHAHHPDHSKPLQVVWLCPICHAREGVIHSHG